MTSNRGIVRWMRLLIHGPACHHFGKGQFSCGQCRDLYGKTPTSQEEHHRLIDSWVGGP